jgi:hypothetical protein
MLLALVDERRPRDDQASTATAQGDHYADLLGGYADVLVPRQVLRHEDEAAVITALQVLAYEHFDPLPHQDDNGADR